MPFQDETETRDQVSWNIAADQAQHISNLIKKAMDYMLKGNIGNCYWSLTGIRILINPYLDTKERIYFSKLEKITNIHSSKWEEWKKSIEDGQPKMDLVGIKNKFSKFVKIYFLKIMDLLRDLGYLPEKEDRTQMGF